MQNFEINSIYAKFFAFEFILNKSTKRSLDYENA